MTLYYCKSLYKRIIRNIITQAKKKIIYKIKIIYYIFDLNTFNYIKNIIVFFSIFNGGKLVEYFVEAKRWQINLLSSILRLLKWTNFSCDIVVRI